MTDMPPATVDAAPREATLWAIAAASVEAQVVPSDVNIVFRRQPKPVEARHRVAYRTALLVLVLSRFNRSAAKLTNLHTVMWATRSARTRWMFNAWWKGRRFYNTTTERLDPDLQITLNLALVDGLVAPAANGTRIRLTDVGRELADMIDGTMMLLAVEKKFLDGLAGLSDASMEKKLAEVPR